MIGPLGSANREIREADRRDQQRRLARLAEPRRLTDHLLGELEELNLDGVGTVPDGYEPELAELREQLEGLARVRPRLIERLQPGTRTAELIDTVFIIQEIISPPRLSAVKTRTWLLLPISAIVIAGCGNGAAAPAKPPTAQEILARPDTANVKDGHFTLVAHIVSGNIAFDATGDGIIVVKPQQASRFTMQTTIAGQPLKFEAIIIGGKEYDLSPDNPHWTVKPSTNSSNPSSFKGTDATYIGEDTLPQGKAWHVKAKDDGGNPFEAWVRESDGYPLKYASTMQGSTFTATFDRFNTGQTISAPPASDIQQ